MTSPVSREPDYAEQAVMRHYGIDFEQWDTGYALLANVLREETSSLRARVLELEQVLRLHLAMAPDDPLLVEPVEKQVVALQAQLHAREATMAALDDAAGFMWVVLANVSGGNWELQSADWQQAVKKARDDYFATRQARGNE